MRSPGIAASYTRAIQFVGQATSDAGSLTLPSGLEVGDVLILMVLDDNSIPTGSGTWTLGGSGTSSGTAFDYYWYWKYFESGDSTVTISGGEEILCVAFRNVDPLNPFDTSATVASGSFSGLPNPPSITTVNPSSVILVLGWLDDDDVALTAPTGYRLISNVFTGGVLGSIAAAYKEQVSAGVEDPGSFGGTGSDEWVAVTIALRSNAYFANMSATGGTEYTSGGYKYHKFTANGNFVVSSIGSVSLIEVLCVAGGGGGGEGISGGGGGGGGAGGLELKTDIIPTATTYAIVVGGGGSGSSTSGTTGSNGNASSFASTTVATVGGGAGGGGNDSGGGAGASTRAGQTGGSGGGGGAGTFLSGTAGGVSVAGEGFAGGAGDVADGGGGGGGAGGVGEAGATDGANNGGDGGLGADYSVWATATSSGVNGFFASGGGGGGDTVGGAASDGGGASGTSGTTNATNATANTGGGGGGSETGNASNGGSGIVIVRYRAA